MREPDDGGIVAASAMLQELHDGAPAGQFTLHWLMASLRRASYPAIIFLLAIIAVIPGISLVPRLLLLVPILQMIARRPAPAFPRWIGGASTSDAQADRQPRARNSDPTGG